METLQKKLAMKTSNYSSKALDPPKTVRAATPANEKQHPPQASSVNISRERLMAGASTTTEVLHEILQHQNPSEQMRHWGINE
jgi:hypothetical protein